MKAIRVHAPGVPDVLKYEDAPDPQMGPGQVLVRVRAAGVNPVDTYIRAGRYAHMPAMPYIPGGDAAGIIEAVGKDVKHVKTGDRVYTAGGNARLLNGCYAELLACDADLVCPMPASLSFAQGAAVGVNYATATRALHHKLSVFQTTRNLFWSSIGCHAAPAFGRREKACAEQLAGMRNG